VIDSTNLRGVLILKVVRKHSHNLPPLVYTISPSCMYIPTNPRNPLREVRRA
jgi:hypothetical protein